MSKLTIKQRILQALQEYKMEPKDLGEGNPSKSRKMRRQIEEDTELTESTLSEILNRFPDLSAEWLLRGTGEMLLNAETRRQRDDNETITSTGIAELKDQLRRKDREIDALYERIEELKRGTAPQTYVATA